MPDFVDAAYQLMLDRAPDSSEKKSQCGSLRAGLGRTRFLGDLALSAEFRQRRDGELRGQSDSAFLEQVYLRYLGRQIDPQGMDAYLRFLARGKSRKRVIRQVARSREAQTRRTTWFELEQLLADELAQRHWLRRWIGQYRRAERLRNRMVEVALLQGSLKTVPNDGAARSGITSPVDVPLDTFATLGLGARRVIGRARQISRMA
ncbi:DUF4214 domain-containing protein [Novosphingobium sp. NBM11]|uniref:DUF4214 domain-containing protein n=1 Tax=Novosphingobium sp. NBM11 TaxID=2596914 RepID=UPI0018925982|nr:DUF4214 domain-containing protein [Novosphingobium sp. NBM11]MBF5090887.1 DUF4214 domain-containing protein [Novosphingobium sp. NBM11]